jgi:hypothetical protein
MEYVICVLFYLRMVHRVHLIFSFSYGELYDIDIVLYECRFVCHYFKSWRLIIYHEVVEGLRAFPTIDAKVSIVYA